MLDNTKIGGYNVTASPSDISQYPLEDNLDKFYVSVSDFYERENYNKEEEGYTNCLLNKSEQQIEVMEIW